MLVLILRRNMQTKKELEEWYKKEDPWGYKKNPDDIKRKKICRT